MSRRRTGEPGFTAREEALLKRLGTPHEIQGYLDRLTYNTDDVFRSPRTVMRVRQARCLDGAVFAAMALSRLGFPPLLVDMQAHRDDDHVLAVFRRAGRWGAVAKSNFVGLRFREPIFKTLRELILSYFENYYNIAGEKTLRAYSRPVDLHRFDHLRWETEDRALSVIVDQLDWARHYPVLTPAMKKRLSPVDPLSIKAGLLGSREEDCYQIKAAKK